MHKTQVDIGFLAFEQIQRIQVVEHFFQKHVRVVLDNKYKPLGLAKVQPFTAIIDISTLACFGSTLTCTVSRAGKLSVK